MRALRVSSSTNLTEGNEGNEENEGEKKIRMKMGCWAVRISTDGDRARQGTNLCYVVFGENLGVEEAEKPKRRFEFSVFSVADHRVRICMSGCGRGWV